MAMSPTQQIHSDQMPFRCDYCQRLFKHKRSRDRHIKLHTGDKRYRCAHCESAFSRSDHLKIHMKTHDHMKPFQCAVCNRGYNTAAALTSHMQNHKRNNNGNNNSVTISSGISPTSSNPNHSPAPTNLSTNNSIKSVRAVLEKDALGKVSAKENHRPGLAPEELVKRASSLQTHGAEEQREQRARDSPASSSSSFVGSQHGNGNALPVSLGSPAKDNGGLLSGHGMQSLQVTCGFCGIKTAALDQHIRETHLHHLLFAGLLQNSFYQAAMPNWPMMPPPALPPAPSALETLSPAHHSSSLMNGLNGQSRTQAPSPPASPPAKRSKSSHSPLSNGPRPAASPSSSSASSLAAISRSGAASMPLLCSQCSASFSDFESFRVHLKSHLLLAQQSPGASLSGLVAASQQQQCPYCGDVITSDFETHIVNSHLGTVSTQYGCEPCSKLFAKPDELQKHLMDIHAHHLYQCSLCRDMFDSKVSAQVHFAVKHSNECKLYKCNVCGELWKNEMEFRLHIKLAHLQTNVAGAMGPSHLAQHSSALNPFPTYMTNLFGGSNAYFKCRFCTEEFHIEFLLERHLETAHGSEMQSERGSRSPSKERLHKSKESAPSGRTNGQHRDNERRDNKLESCLALPVTLPSSKLNGSSKSARDELNSATLMQGALGGKSASTKCNICDAVCSSLSDLAAHKLQKHCVFGAGTSQTQCVECHGTISSQSDYLKHFAMHYALGSGGPGERGSLTRFPVSCIICKQTLMRELEIDLHARFHCPSDVSSPSVSPSTLACSIKAEKQHGQASPPRASEAAVSATASSPENVKPETPPSTPTPTNGSLSSKRFQCIQCQKSFSSEWDIEKHVRLHMEESEGIVCNLCDSEYETPAKLQGHLIEHNFNGGDEYKCPVANCKRPKWISASALLKHMNKEHLEERPFSCSHCQQRFWFPTELDNHNIGAHKDEEVDVEDIRDDDELSTPAATLLRAAHRRSSASTESLAEEDDATDDEDEDYGRASASEAGSSPKSLATEKRNKQQLERCRR